jgi:hypothetical protein
VRVAQRRCALYGLLIYRQGDSAGVFFSYDFDRNKVVLLPEVKDPRCRDLRELKVPVVVYIEVVYLTDAAASGVEDLLLAEFVVRGSGLSLAARPDPPLFSLVDCWDASAVWYSRFTRASLLGLFCSLKGPTPSSETTRRDFRRETPGARNIYLTSSPYTNILGSQAP